MSYLKITPDLFLGSAELNRQKKFLDDDGFRKNILDNSTGFGLIKSSKDSTFPNGKVERDVDTALGQRAIKVKELTGIDKNGNFLYSPALNGIVVPNDGNWYWVKATYAQTNVEKGTFSIATNGDLVDTSGKAELTKLLRGMPNFPARIRFKNSTNNTLEYDVLDVIDDQHATLQHPATNSNGISAFTAETGLQIEVVGTFTQGIAVPAGSKAPFNYDSASVTLVQEGFSNTKPTSTKDVDFFLARVKATNSTVIVQDKRMDIWETKGSGINLEITRAANPLIGIESVQFNNLNSPTDKNIVKLAWGIRSDNWAVDPSSNTITFNSGNGGKYKTTADFVSGDCDGWRLYAPNGKYGKVVGSTKQGSAINFILDVLDVNNFSSDGGTTFIQGTLLAVPDCEQVEVQFTPHPADNVAAIQQSFTFPVNELVGRCDVLAYKDVSLYNVKYRYKNIKEFTEFVIIPSDTLKGYLTEASFDDAGNLKPVADRVYKPYTSLISDGFIEVNICPTAISKFRQKVDKGDLIGVQELTNTELQATVNLNVGTTKNYLYVKGALNLTQDVYFSVGNGLAEGNEFNIHFNASSVSFNGFKIMVVTGFGTGGQAVLKEIKKGDIYQMLNQEGGIVITLKYKASAWVMYQNYDLGVPNDIKYVRGMITDLFDSNGVGKVRGLFGYGLMDGRNNLPDVRHMFLLGADPNNVKYGEGKTGGEEEHTLILDEIPKFDIPAAASSDTGVGAIADGNPDGQSSKISVGGGKPHNNMPPFYAVIIASKLDW